MLDEQTRALWHFNATRGTPPPPREYAELCLGLQTPWHVVDHFFPVLSSMRIGGPKSYFVREVSRGHAKTWTTYMLVLYAAEFILPYLPISDINRRIILVGRDEKHVHNNVMAGLHDFICHNTPWLKLRDWKAIHEVEGPAGVKNAKPKNFNKSQFDLTNGVTLQGRSIKQGLRGEHVYLIIVDDLIDEESYVQSEQFASLLDGAFRPAIEDGGTILVTGTPQADDDLYDILSKDPLWSPASLPAESPDYRAKNEDAVKRGLLPALSITCDADWTCLWPWRKNHVSLQRERGATPRSMLKYEREYLLKRIAESDALISSDDIAAAKDPTLHYIHSAAEDEGPYAGGADPSSLSKDDACVCIGIVDSEGKRIPRHFAMVRAEGAAMRKDSAEPELKFVMALNEASKAFGNPPIKLEKNGYQGAVRPLARFLNRGIAISKLFLGSMKHTDAGWLMIRTVFRNRQVRLPWGPTPMEAAQIAAGLLDPSQTEARRITNEFIAQLRNLRLIDGQVVQSTKLIHDDMPSAFYLFLKQAEAYGNGDLGVSSTDIPQFSANLDGPPKPMGAEFGRPQGLHGRLNEALRLGAQRRRLF